MALVPPLRTVRLMNTLITRDRFPVVIATALAIAAFIGFSRTYYLKFLFDRPPLVVAMHIHGVLSTLWLALHYTQARLIAAHRVTLHKRLGIAGAILGLVLTLQAGYISIEGALAGHAPPGRVPLQFLSVSFGTTCMFGLFLSLALLLRRYGDWHKRFMLMTTMVLLLPAIGRIDGLLFQAFHIERGVVPFVVTAIFLGWACVHDWRKRGRVHPAYLLGGTVLLAAIPFRMWLGYTDAWMPFARWLTGA
jgi:hypothetical protein